MGLFISNGLVLISNDCVDVPTWVSFEDFQKEIEKKNAELSAHANPLSVSQQSPKPYPVVVIQDELDGLFEPREP